MITSNKDVVLINRKLIKKLPSNSALLLLNLDPHNNNNKYSRGTK